MSENPRYPASQYPASFSPNPVLAENNMIAFAIMSNGALFNKKSLEEAVRELIILVTEKVAYPTKYRPTNISFDNFERVRMTIIAQAVALYLSGKLDEMSGKEKHRERLASLHGAEE